MEKNAIKGYQDGLGDAEIRNRLNGASLELGKVRKQGECVVVLAHRNEVDAWTKLGAMMMDFLPGLAAYGPVVFLCGHEHTSKIASEYSKKVLLVRGVPSVDGPGLPLGQLPKLGYIELKRRHGRVAGAIVHTFHKSVGGWLRPWKSDSFTWSVKDGWR